MHLMMNSWNPFYSPEPSPDNCYLDFYWCSQLFPLPYLLTYESSCSLSSPGSRLRWILLCRMFTNECSYDQYCEREENEARVDGGRYWAAHSLVILLELQQPFRVALNWTQFAQALMTSHHSVIAPHWGRKWPQVRSSVQLQQSLKELASEDFLFTTFPVTGAASASLTGHLGSILQCPHHYYLQISIPILAG